MYRLSLYGILCTCAFLFFAIAPDAEAYDIFTSENHICMDLDGKIFSCDECDSGFVIDTRYNLMWERKSSDPTSPMYEGRLLNYEEAYEYAVWFNEWFRKNVSMDEYPVWRLPSAMEMATIVDLSQSPSDPSIDRVAFPNVGRDHYWTLSEYPPVPSCVQYTSFAVGNQFKWMQSGKLRTMLVAGGGWYGRYDHGGTQYGPGPYSYYPEDFTVTTETVTDHATGLMWEQKAWLGDERWECEEPLVLLFEQIESLAGMVFELPELAFGAMKDDFLADLLLYDQIRSGVLGLTMVQLASETPKLLTDVMIGLITELQRAEGAGFVSIHPSSYLTFYDHEGAMGYIDELNEREYAGFRDWRMPTAGEIMTTTDWNRVPCCKDVFSPTIPWLYWTSTPDPHKERHYFT